MAGLGASTAPTLFSLSLVDDRTTVIPALMPQPVELKSGGGFLLPPHPPIKPYYNHADQSNVCPFATCLTKQRANMTGSNG